MQGHSSSLLLPIGDAVEALRRLYPDITHSTLRFLEGEGLLRPTRTPGGHRLYAPADLARVEAIKAWQAQRLSLDEIRQRLDALSELDVSGDLARCFLDALVAADPAACRIVLEADTLGVPLPRLFREVVGPALIAVGDRWQRGDLRVGQEHAATELVRELMIALALRHRHPHPSGDAILAACVAGERHELGLQMLVTLLRAEGRPVLYLGADVDVAILGEEVIARQPTIVLLSASLADRLPAAKESVDAVQEAAGSRPIRIILGGRAADAIRTEMSQWGIEIGSDEFAVALQTILSADAE